MGLVCLVCGTRRIWSCRSRRLAMAPSVVRSDGLDVPGIASASGLMSVVQTAVVTAPSHGAA